VSASAHRKTRAGLDRGWKAICTQDHAQNHAQIEEQEAVIRRKARSGHRPEHDPEKWNPVFRKDHAPAKI
jgi:hypothetical protein